MSLSTTGTGIGFFANDVTVADSYFPRLVGFLGKTKRWTFPSRGMWIVPSRGVHSVGVRRQHFE